MIDALLSFLISLEMSDNDRRALLILVIILLILLFIIGLIGMGIRWIIMRQADKADDLMYEVTVAHVINNPRDYRKMASKKNFRLFFQKSLIPLGVIALGVLIWVIYSAIVDGWNRNIFEEFLDLFFLWHYEDPENYVQIFGMTFLAKWPAPFEDHPAFHVEHLASYIVVPIVVGGSLAYLYQAQGYMVRALVCVKRSNEVFRKSLKGYNANTLDPNSVPYDPNLHSANDSNKL